MAVKRAPAGGTAAKPANARKTVGKKAASPLTDPSEVDEYMRKLKHPLKAEMAAVREIIRKANRKLAERIKWNAPSYHYAGADMAAFNPRQTQFVQVIFVFPRGIMEVSGAVLLQGTWKDRREARFFDMKDVVTKRAALRRVVNGWVERMDAERG